MSFVRLSLALGIIIPSYLGLPLREPIIPLNIKGKLPLPFLNLNLGLKLTQRNSPNPLQAVLMMIRPPLLSTLTGPSFFIKNPSFRTKRNQIRNQGGNAESFNCPKMGGLGGSCRRGHYDSRVEAVLLNPSPLSVSPPQGLAPVSPRQSLSFLSFQIGYGEALFERFFFLSLFSS